MSNWWNNLNLTPQERKFVIGVVIAFAIVLNFLFIWPQFKEWTPLQEDLQKKRETLAEYEAKVAEMPKILARLSVLETNSAPVMVSGDAAAHYSRTVQTLAQQTRFTYDRMNTPTVNLNSTNKYFQELTMRVTFTGTEEKDLVNFLYRLSDGNSSIRVREFSIKPDQSKMLLLGYLTLVANYEVESATSRAPGMTAPAKAKSTNLTAKTP